MANNTKKFMYIDLEFMDAEKYGYVNIMNSSGDVGATIGMGNAEEKSIGFYGTDEMEEFEISKYNNVVISNYNKDENGDITEYLPVNFIMRGSDSKIEYEKEVDGELIKMGSFALNKSNLNTYEKATGVEWDLTDENGDPKTAMGLEHSSAIAFINPDTNRLVGIIDTVKETFTWDGGFSLGEDAPDSMFETKASSSGKMNITINSTPDINPIFGIKIDDTLLWKFEAKNDTLFVGSKDDKGMKVLDGGDVEFTDSIIYKGSILDSRFYTTEALDDGQLDNRYYTREEIETNYYTRDEIETNYYTRDETIEEIKLNSSNVPSYIDERGLYVFIGDKWEKVDYTTVDEVYDIPDDANSEEVFWCELESGFYYGNGSSLSYTTEISFDDIFIPIEEQLAFVINEKRIYKFDGENWNRFQSEDSEDEIVKVSPHKKDIDIESVVNDEVYFIESTKLFYKVVDGSLEKTDIPEFCFYDKDNLPTTPDEEDYLFVEGGKFYQYDGSSFIEIDKPLEIPMIHDEEKLKYNIQNKIVFVTRGK